MRNALAHVKKPFGAGTKRYVAQLALALVCYFYLIRAYITWSNEAQALKARKLWHFYFNKVCSSKILTCVRQEPVARYFLLGLATHYRES